MRLLDVNVLLALAYPKNTFHEATKRWFVNLNDRSFATCALTESALLRLLRNTTIIPTAPSIEVCMSMLSQIRATPGHRFLKNLPSPIEPAIEKEILHVRGYRQMPDAYLIGLAVYHGFQFATLDAKLVETYGPEHIELIPTA